MIFKMCKVIFLAKQFVEALPSTLKITKMEMCDPTADYPLKLANQIVTKDDGMQYLSGVSVFTVDFGKDSDVSCVPKSSKPR